MIHHLQTKIIFFLDNHIYVMQEQQIQSLRLLAYESLSDPPTLPPLHHIPGTRQTLRSRALTFFLITCHLNYWELSDVVLPSAQLTESPGIKIALMPYYCPPNYGGTSSPIFKVVAAHPGLLVLAFPVPLPATFYFACSALLLKPCPSVNTFSLQTAKNCFLLHLSKNILLALCDTCCC